MWRRHARAGDEMVRRGEMEWVRTTGWLLLVFAGLYGCSPRATVAAAGEVVADVAAVDAGSDIAGVDVSVSDMDVGPVDVADVVDAVDAEVSTPDVVPDAGPDAPDADADAAPDVDLSIYEPATPCTLGSTCEGGYPCMATVAGNRCGWLQRASMPAARASFAWAWGGGKLWVYGGKTPEYNIYLGDGKNYPMGLANDFWSYDPEADVWTVLPEPPLAPALIPHVAWAQGKLFASSGYATKEHSNRAAVYDPSVGTWQPLPIEGQPKEGAGCSGPSAYSYCGFNLTVMGDEIAAVPAEIVPGSAAARIDLKTLTWKPMSLVNAPSWTRNFAWLGKLLIEYGSNSPASSYDPLTDTWALIEQSPYLATAQGVIAGDELIVWGSGSDAAPKPWGALRHADGSWHGLVDPDPPTNDNNLRGWLGGKAVYFTWGTGTNKAMALVYRPSTDKWSYVPAYPPGPPGDNTRDGALVPMADGSVLIVGGDVWNASPNWIATSKGVFRIKL